MIHDTENVSRMQVIPDGNGLILPFSNDFQTLMTFAEAYFYLGYSVIPLLGDQAPARSKTPAIPWIAYQKRRAFPAEQASWFMQDGFAGLGIVTGHISQLVVLDFDSEAVYRAFRAKCPDLLETHAVKSATRQLPHLYFRLPSHLHLPSQKGQGIDLLSDGRYVVAPPTVINGQSYKVSYGAIPKTLTERDIRRIQTFLNTYKDTQPPSSVPPTVLSVPSAEPQPPRPLTENDLHALYHHLVATRGRNEALFHTSLLARDGRLTLQQTQRALIALHSQQKTLHARSRENLRQREQEALKTIQSAFSRPPRVLRPSLTRQKGMVSNSVREALLQRKMTYLIRTYEGLLQSGMRPGQRFTAMDALKRLQGLVGRDSVLKALKAQQDGVLFFVPPVNPRNTANAIAHSHKKKKSKKCFLIEGKNQEKPHNGRPPRWYQLPTNKLLCQILGVKLTSSDTLEPTDLRSARKTRLALHAELIKRRPNAYTKRWLGMRLGVSRRTIFTYNRLVPIHSREVFLETAITWKTIERLPLDEPLQGGYLQTLRGKKYPALRQIASRLLAEGEHICLKEQSGNFYWYGEAEPALLEWAKVTHEQAQKQEAAANFMSRQIALKPPPISPALPHPPEKLKLSPSRKVYKEPFKKCRP